MPKGSLKHKENTWVKWTWCSSYVLLCNKRSKSKLTHLPLEALEGTAMSAAHSLRGVHSWGWPNKKVLIQNSFTCLEADTSCDLKHVSSPRGCVASTQTNNWVSNLSIPRGKKGLFHPSQPSPGIPMTSVLLCLAKNHWDSRRPAMTPPLNGVQQGLVERVGWETVLQPVLEHTVATRFHWVSATYLSTMTFCQRFVPKLEINSLVKKKCSELLVWARLLTFTWQSCGSLCWK
jgi:hypothetical protein